MSELQEKLMGAQNEAAATKEELNSCKESLEKLQELLQVQNHLDILNLYNHKLGEITLILHFETDTFGVGRFELM